MLAEITPATIIAFVFFITCGGYAFFSVNTIISDFHSKLIREHFMAVLCLVFSCLFYGFMTIVDNEEALRFFWGAGYISYFLFLPVWIRFVCNMYTVKNVLIKHILRWVLIVISLALSITCVLSDQVVFVATSHGNQFTFNGSLLSKIIAIYVLILCVIVVVSHINWWRESIMKRQRVQQRMFLILTLLFAPIGYVTDFVFPAFSTNYTITPLVSVLLFPAAMQLYISMRHNKTISITVPNVSEYIFKSVMVPIIILDHDNTTRLENNAALEFFGSSLIGKNVSDIFTIDGDPMPLSVFDSDSLKRSVDIDTPSGIRICDILITVENDKYGDALCKVVMMRDMTDITEAFLQVEKVNTDLLNTSDQLESAFKEATAASKAKTYFLANMSHEMRTPMNAIIGMAHMGKMADEQARKDYCLIRIEEASKHLLGVINDVLDFSKIESGKFELGQAYFSFRKVIQRVLNVVKHRADDKNQTIRIESDENIPEILIGDEQRLAQVITNILGNAVKFTPEGGSIGFKTQLLSMKYDVCKIQVSITDNGVGISPEQQEKLFESFHQIENDLTRSFDGTGLGLSISKSIVEMMNGKIWVESEPGKGSTFTFNVQLLQGEDHLAKVRNATTIQSQKINTFEGRRALLVEDIDINREIVLGILEDSMLEIDCVENGKDAVDTFAATPDMYDIIFMDIQMPEMDGYEATRAIRMLDSASAKFVPIIAMTANVFLEDVEKCIASGMNGHIGKPIDYLELMELLRVYLS